MLSDVTTVSGLIPDDELAALAVLAEAAAAGGIYSAAWSVFEDAADPPTIAALVAEVQRHRAVMAKTRPRPMPVCTDPDCTIPRKPGYPMHGPHDFRAARTEAT